MKSIKSNPPTKIDELLSIYRGALIAIIPWIEKVKIPWKEGEAYDDWDEICQTLFKNIVVNAIAMDDLDQNMFVKYDLRYADYKDNYFISVHSKKKEENKEIAAFISFRSEKLDVVEVGILNPEFKPVRYERYSLEECSFIVMRFRDSLETIAEVEI